MIEEFEKYKTGKKVDGKGVLLGGQQVDIKLDEYIFPLGDLMVDFNNHLNKKWWQKIGWEHNFKTKLYLKVLNQITITHNFR